MGSEPWAHRIVRWYESDSLWLSAIGAWVKLCYEFTVAAVPLVPIFLLLGVGVPSLTFAVALSGKSVVVQWVSASLTITGIRWCFLRAGVKPD